MPQSHTFKEELTSDRKRNSSSPDLSMEFDFGKILSKHGLTYEIHEPFYQVGNLSRSQGWLLHLTCIYPTFRDYLDQVLPLLRQVELSFRVVRNERILKQFNEGGFGTQKVGKCITIFIQDGMVPDRFMDQLIALSEKFYGPSVSTDHRIRGNMYYRYGSFKPDILTDGKGYRYRYMRGAKDELIPDNYSLPPFLPTWEPDPFQQWIVKAVPDPDLEVFFKQFKPDKAIKSDAKGKVLKGTYLADDLTVRPCIVKQGKKGAFVEKDHADAVDKIVWQYHLQEALCDKLNVPKPLGLYRGKEEAYIAMEFIQGNGLAYEMFLLLKNRAWFELSKYEKQRGLQILLKVARQLDGLHKAGYYHRDLTCNNFMVDKLGEVWLIDLELSYHFAEGEPAVPFTTGTLGYISPQQKRKELPAIEDDYYAFGALTLMCMTGVEPEILHRNFEDTLSEKTKFFLTDIRLEELIVRCMDDDPNERPDLSSIIRLLQQIAVQPMDSSTRVMAPEIKGGLAALVERGIASLGTGMMSAKGEWVSAIHNQYDQEVYPLNNRAVFGGMHRGQAGMLYTLLQLHELGYDIRPAIPNMEVAWQVLFDIIGREQESLSVGLHYGTSGIALVISMGIRAGILENSPGNLDLLHELINRYGDDLDIIDGLSGQGLAVMQIAKALPEGIETAAILAEITRRIILQQGADGAWSFHQGEGLVKINGFGYGIAGVIYYLLVYGARYNSQEAVASATKGLGYLEYVGKLNNGELEWSNSEKDDATGIWWCHGAPGIALTFLKAFELLGDRKYLRKGELALMVLHERPVTYQISQCHGLTGVGEIYLTAFQVTGNKKWLERASWVRDLLLALQLHDKEELPYWLVEHYQFPTADLMIGNAGIIRFLARFDHPDQLTFPLLG